MTVPTEAQIEQLAKKLDPFIFSKTAEEYLRPSEVENRRYDVRQIALAALIKEFGP